MEITPRILLYAYCDGIFPMGEEDQLYWYAPDPRAILPLDQFHVPRRLQRTVRRGLYDIRVNTAFADVMAACAAPGSGRESTWITDEIFALYAALHEAGFAHSVEAWQDGNLVGGLYGVAINSFFAGESMFALARDASKVALVHLVQRLCRRGYLLLDTQFMTGHLARFGAVELSREAYLARLDAALQKPNLFDEAFPPRPDRLGPEPEPADV